MDADGLAFLDGTTPEEPEPVAEQTTEPAQPVVTGEPAAAPPAATNELPHVPLTAVLDEREKRKEAQREAEELRRQLAQYTEKPQAVPDLFENPDQRLAMERQQYESGLIATKLEMSKFMAIKEFGEDVVNAAFEFFNDPKNSPQSHELIKHPSPFHAAVEVYRRNQAMAEIGADPAAYKSKLESEIEARVREKIMAEMAAAQPSKPRIPTSLASAPAAGAGEPVSKGTAFDRAFQ